MQFVYNIDVSRPRTTSLQMLVVANLYSMIEVDLCKHCHKRETTNTGEPTQKDHPKAKDDMDLEAHNFQKDKKAGLVILDSITGKFRKEFEGRGTLSDRQVKLTSHVRLLESVVEAKNVVCLVTNQAQELLGVMGSLLYTNPSPRDVEQ